MRYGSQWLDQAIGKKIWGDMSQSLKEYIQLPMWKQLSDYSHENILVKVKHNEFLERNLTALSCIHW